MSSLEESFWAVFLLGKRRGCSRKGNEVYRGKVFGAVVPLSLLLLLPSFFLTLIKHRANLGSLPLQFDVLRAVSLGNGFISRAFFFFFFMSARVLPDALDI